MGTLPGDTQLIMSTKKFPGLHFFSPSTGIEKEKKEAELNRERQMFAQKQIREFQNLPGNS